MQWPFLFLNLSFVPVCKGQENLCMKVKRNTDQCTNSCINIVMSLTAPGWLIKRHCGKGNNIQAMVYTAFLCLLHFKIFLKLICRYYKYCAVPQPLRQ